MELLYVEHGDQHFGVARKDKSVWDNQKSDVLKAVDAYLRAKTQDIEAHWSIYNGESTSIEYYIVDDMTALGQMPKNETSNDFIVQGAILRKYVNGQNIMELSYHMYPTGSAKNITGNGFGIGKTLGDAVKNRH